jgi:Tat protein secretion system quality control protein TatD with DNase activity
MGIHPSDARWEEVPETLEYIKANIGSIAAIGEIGLAFWYRWVRKMVIRFIL